MALFKRKKASEEITGEDKPEPVPSASTENNALDALDEGFTAVGTNGDLVVMPTKVLIRRKGWRGFVAQGLQGDKEIRIDQISSIQFCKAGGLVLGYIQFAFVGGVETKRGAGKTASYENPVTFDRKQEPDFAKAKALIDEYRDRAARPMVTAAPSSGLDDLERLAELRDKGIITEEEFVTKKRQILGL